MAKPIAAGAVNNVRGHIKMGYAASASAAPPYIVRSFRITWVVDFADEMQVGQTVRPDMGTAHTAHKNRPHSSHTFSAWFSAWKKQVDSSATATACGFATSCFCVSAGKETKLNSAR